MDNPENISRILQLSATINASVVKIQKVIDALGVPSPTFNEDAPTLPAEIDEARDVVLDATAELHDLLTDPMNMIHRSARGDNSACLQTIARFDIARLVPLGGRVSFAEIARQTPLTEQMVGRIIRHAAMMHIFYEPRTGMVAHTKASSLLANSDTRDWIRAGTEELGPAAGKFAEALEKWPGSQEPNETGFTLANNTTGSIYDVIAQNPDRAVRFANAMKVMTSRPEFDLSYAIDYFDWASLGKAEVVDVGGAQGHFALGLARRHPNLRILVQDMAPVVQGANAGDMADRVSFMAHNLFEPQTISADVYFFRWIFHNWSDQHCIRILKAQLPALKPGNRLMVQEVLMQEAGTIAQWKAKDSRSMDLEMAYTFNARERTAADWKTLFEEADPAFELQSVIQPKGSALGVLIYIWKGAVGA